MAGYLSGLRNKLTLSAMLFVASNVVTASVTRLLHPYCHTDPLAWLQTAPSHEGSWWLAWEDWLQAGAGKRVKPPAMGGAAHTVLEDAPGRYVLMS